MVPLFYAPIVPLMRVMLRGRVPTERLTQMTLGVIAVDLAHARSTCFPTLRSRTAGDTGERSDR